MKKVGIVTYPNIEDGKGRFLQAYTLYSAVKELGYEAEILNYFPEGLNRSFSVKRMLKAILEDPSKIYGYVCTFKHKIFGKIQQKNKQNSILKYKKYIKENIKGWSEQFLSASDLRQIVHGYDAFICGSDQIWNPYFTCGQDENYYLQFAPYKKRIAYAASMGTVQIDENLLQESINRISNIKYCSVREKDTRDLLSQKSNLHITQVCDPTFLMERDWWDNLASAPKLEYGYVLTFLFDNNPEPRKMANKIAKERGLRVVSIQEGLSDVFGKTIRMSGLGPEEFVSLFKNAEFVCTQSFHGTVLSLIFQKDFLVFDRSEKGQVDGLVMRIGNLLREVGLEERVVHNEEVASIGEINYKAVEEKLDIQRLKSKKFLNDALRSACEED